MKKCRIDDLNDEFVKPPKKKIQKVKFEPQEIDTDIEQRFRKKTRNRK